MRATTYGVTELLPSQGRPVCPACEARTFSARRQTFARGVAYVRVGCAECGRFVFYIRPDQAEALRREGN